MTIDELKAQIDSTIKSNGQRLITGAQLNSILNAIATYTAEVEGVSLKVPQFLPFDSIIANADVQVGSTSATDYEIVYVESKNVFTAYTGGVYYTDWVGSLSYNKGTFSKSAIATNLYINPYAEIYKIENSKLVAIQKYDIANVVATYGDGLATLSYKGSTIYPETKGSQVKLSIGKNAEDAIKQNSSNIVKEKERAQQVEMYLESQKADKSGYYENLSVGVSDNLSGRGEATESEFSMRPSGGENKSIQDGTARINSIKGNSVVYNNIVQNRITHGSKYTITKNSDGSYVVKLNPNFDSTTGNNWINDFTDKLENGHRYYFYIPYKVSGLSEGATVELYLYDVSGIKQYGKTGITNGIGSHSVIFDCDYTGSDNGRITPFIPLGELNTEFTIYGDRKCVDLTKMFNGVNVPTTVEEFEALYGNMPNEYNAGTIIDNHTTAIKSVGVNAWDEEITYDTIGIETGNVVNNPERIASKNYCKCIGGAKYYVSKPSNVGLNLLWYDKDKNYISFNYSYGYYEFTAPTNARFFKINLYNTYGTTYNHDICIHLVHTGYLNGKYFPYESQTRQLPTVEGGLKSAGTAYDEIRYNRGKDKWEHVQRVGSVDLGTLEWSIYNAEYLIYNAKLLGNGSEFNFLSPIYRPSKLGYSDMPNNTIRSLSGYLSYITVRNTAYTDVATFKTAMQGVILYYELAEPIVTELDVNISPDYKVWDYGTEEAISEVLSTPVRINANYGFNAVGQITDNTELIKELLARVAVLEAKIAQANSANVEPIEPVVE